MCVFRGRIHTHRVPPQWSAHEITLIYDSLVVEHVGLSQVRSIQVDVLTSPLPPNFPYTYIYFSSPNFLLFSFLPSNCCSWNFFDSHFHRACLSKYRRVLCILFNFPLSITIFDSLYKICIQRIDKFGSGKFLNSISIRVIPIVRLLGELIGNCVLGGN